MTSKSSGQQARPVPLQAWLWAGLFLLAGIGLFDALLERVDPPQPAAFQDYNLSRIATFDAAFPKGEAFRIVAIGNSRLKYATLDDQEMTDLAENLGAGRLAMLRLVNNSAVFRDFEPLTQALLAIEPDLIVLQLDLMAIAQSEVGRRALAHEYLTWQLLGYGPWYPRDISPWAVQYGKPCTRVPPRITVDTGVWQTRQWIEEDTSSASARQVRRFIDKAVQAGIPVILIAVPATDAMERVFPSDHDAFIQGAAAVQEKHHGIELLRYPGPIPNERACDAVHMDEVARQHFSRWLITELSDRFGRLGRSR